MAFARSGEAASAEAAEISPNRASAIPILFIYLQTFGGGEAGSGNRTRMISLEGWSFAIKLYPRYLCTHSTIIVRECKHYFQKNDFFYFSLDIHPFDRYTSAAFSRGRRSMVGRVLPKHETRVRFPSPVFPNGRVASRLCRL